MHSIQASENSTNYYDFCHHLYTNTSLQYQPRAYNTPFNQLIQNPYIFQARNPSTDENTKKTYSIFASHYKSDTVHKRCPSPTPFYSLANLRLVKDPLPLVLLLMSRVICFICRRFGSMRGI